MMALSAVVVTATSRGCHRSFADDGERESLRDHMYGIVERRGQARRGEAIRGSVKDID